MWIALAVIAAALAAAALYRTRSIRRARKEKWEIFGIGHEAGLSSRQCVAIYKDAESMAEQLAKHAAESGHPWSEEQKAGATFYWYYSFLTQRWSRNTGLATMVFVNESAELFRAIMHGDQTEIAAADERMQKLADQWNAIRSARPRD